MTRSQGDFLQNPAAWSQPFVNRTYELLHVPPTLQPPDATTWSSLEQCFPGSSVVLPFFPCNCTGIYCYFLPDFKTLIEIFGCIIAIIVARLPRIERIMQQSFMYSLMIKTFKHNCYIDNRYNRQVSTSLNNYQNTLEFNCKCHEQWGLTDNKSFLPMDGTQIITLVVFDQ